MADARTGEPRPKAVVFDMGGVLAPDCDYGELLGGLDGAAAAAARQMISRQWAAARCVPDFPMEDFFRPVLAAAGVPGDDWARIDASVKARFVPFWQVLGVVDRVRRAGYRVGIISNHLCSHFDSWMARYGLGDLFPEPDLVVVSSRARCAKPDPGIYRHFCERSGLSPQDCVFVDNKQANVDAAVALGWRAFRFHHVSKDGRMKDHVDVLVGGLLTSGVAI
mmetsp:Transcript_17425/g.49483  ORF Transcript_17425/g.49483 Transcript_17425/m.49483 type:complete len:222 (+) Transcript_17425:65-730(+)